MLQSLQYSPKGPIEMIRFATIFSTVFLLFFLNACNDQRHSGDTTHPAQRPHLMLKGSELRGIVRPAGDHSSAAPAVAYPRDPALTLREMEMKHRERLAAIEAEKAKALEALELEKVRSVEELRKRTAEIEAQNALRLQEEKRKYAELMAEKEQAIKSLEANVSLHRDQTQTQIAQLQTQAQKTLAEIRGKYEETIALLQTKFKEKTLWVVVGLFLLLLLLWFLFYRYRKSLEARAREEERRHEAMMLERRLRHEEVEKVLEIIASDQTDESVKIELARLLQKGAIDGDDPKLLEYKKGVES